MAVRASDAPGPGPAPIEVQLVPMRRRHLRSVLRIEAQVYPRPWSLPLFMSELNLRNSRAYYVARVGGTVVGYAGLMLIGEDAHVNTIAVDPAREGRTLVAKQVTLDGAKAVPAVAQALVEAASWVDCTSVRVERVDAPELRDALTRELARTLG